MQASKDNGEHLLNWWAFVVQQSEEDGTEDLSRPDYVTASEWSRAKGLGEVLT